MTRADAFGYLLSFLARLITGAQGHWKGCPPKAEQRIYFANHQSHFDIVLIWAAFRLGTPVVTLCIALTAGITIGVTADKVGAF